MDHAGLPLKTVLEQLDLLGEEVVPVLRKEFEARRPRHVPSDPPTHATLVAAAGGPRTRPSTPPATTSPAGPPRSTAVTRTLAVVTAGLSQPSSTRLLADRLAEATDRALRLHDEAVAVEVVELRDLAHDLTNNLLTGFPSEDLAGAIDDRDAGGRGHRGHADLQCVVQRAVQDLLRRARRRTRWPASRC